jgi:hypothetical protein
MVAALGRAMWNFFSLEEGVVAILYRSGALDLDSSRALDPRSKEQRLRQVRDVWRRDQAPSQLLDAMDRAISAFGEARKKYRNALAHAHAYTAGADDDGTYLPGLSHVTRNGSRVELGKSPDDLLAIAHAVEDASEPIEEVRRLLRLAPSS